jgi:hypothetical protein
MCAVVLRSFHSHVLMSCRWNAIHVFHHHCKGLGFLVTGLHTHMRTKLPALILLFHLTSTRAMLMHTQIHSKTITHQHNVGANVINNVTGFCHYARLIVFFHGVLEDGPR